MRERIAELQSIFPETEFIAHFHDTRGNGIVNSIAALERLLEAYKARAEDMAQAISRVENSGIIFLDEIDKILKS